MRELPACLVIILCFAPWFVFIHRFKDDPGLMLGSSKQEHGVITKEFVARHTADYTFDPVGPPAVWPITPALAEYFADKRAKGDVAWKDGPFVNKWARRGRPRKEEHVSTWDEVVDFYYNHREVPGDWRIKLGMLMTPRYPTNVKGDNHMHPFPEDDSRWSHGQGKSDEVISDLIDSYLPPSREIPGSYPTAGR